jgi:hypothetical protein
MFLKGVKKGLHNLFIFFLIQNNVKNVRIFQIKSCLFRKIDVFNR